MIFGLTEYGTGVLASHARRRAAVPEPLTGEIRRIVHVQAALQHVATLVAQGTRPEDVFAAVAAEAGRVLEVDHTNMIRFAPDGTGTVVGSWTSIGAGGPVPVGSRVSLGGSNLPTSAFETSRSTRFDDSS
jgi:hypothetical protein